MQKAHLIYVSSLGIILTFFGFVFWFSQNDFSGSDYSYDPVFDSYISAYTEGEISRKTPVRVRFTHEMVPIGLVGVSLEESPFDFSPSIQGSTKWEDTRTLVFTPEEVLPSSSRYGVSVNMKDIWQEIPEEAEKFHFQFHTRPQDIKVELTANELIAIDDHQWQKVSGVVKTVDFEKAETIENLFETKGGKGIRIKWEHNEDSRTHSFTIDSLPRSEETYSLALKWDGKEAGIPQKGEQAIIVPAKGIFRHLHTYAYVDPQPFIVVEFTDKLAPQQDLTGMITLPGTKLKYDIDGNRIKVYPQKRISGATKLQISPGIRSVEGDQMNLPYQETITFNEVKPEVRWIGKGVILPKGKTLPVVFEAIGLNAIDVRVIKIFEDNIPQFFQVNRLEESKELKRVGKVVAMKRISLAENPEAKDLDLNQWNRHSLDLSDLIETDPGAIYEVAIGFRRSYSFYSCGSEADEDVDILSVGYSWNVYQETSENSYWDYWGYNYQDRDDPCKKAYYRKDKIAKRNILASDLGLIAKRGTDGMHFFVTDLHSTQPQNGVRLEAYDFQQQLLGSFTTDEKGMAKMPSAEYPPFLLVAKKGNQRGYLRLDDGSALSMSRFDISGKTYVKGVKGFIYGERGVWRPGDPIYLNFVLEDKEGNLPGNHPVSFELIDPKGKVIDQDIRNEGLNGFYAFPTKTREDAITGNYTARVRVGGATFTKVVKVETILPNRLRIELDFGKERLNPETFGASGTLTSTWLHGAIARNLKATAKVNLTRMTTSFAKYSDYHFDDLVGSFPSEEKVLFDGKLDEYGKAQIPTKIKVSKHAPGRLSANFAVRVFEPGGAFSIDRFKIPFDPFNAYVGVKAPKGDAARNMLLTDQDHKIEVVTVDPDGNPLSRKLDVKVYKLEWKWWWDKSADNIGIYNGKVRANEIRSATVQTNNGYGTYNLKIEYPDWGRYLVRVKDTEGGHASGQIVYVDWPGWAGRSTNRETDGAKMLSFTADKESYDVGDDITLNIPTASGGRMLVSLESGTKVIETHWVNAQEGATKFSFKASQEMAPSIYANVTLLQPHAQTKNDLPIRMYGILPIKVEDPQTHLNPVIAMGDELKPNSKVNIAVSEATGKPMTYTLAVVDEGLLGLTRFQTPNPWNTFYQKEALDVKTWDIFDQVIGAYGGEIKSLLSIGGDGANVGPEGKKPDRFKPVVKFLGPFYLKKGEKVTHTIDMPNYIGAVRTMVVAGDKSGAYGAAEKSTPVKQPLMVLGTLPRVIGPGEKVQLPVTIFAMEDNLRTVTLSLKVGGKLLINGNDQQIVRFSASGEKTAAFEVDVLPTIGKTPVTITAKSGGEIAVYETDIEIRNPNPRITDVFAKTVQNKETWTQAYAPLGTNGTNHGIFEVSYLPPLNLGQRLNYLIRYPYGCIEQTTSSVFPQLYLANLVELTSEQKRETDHNIKKGIDRLLKFQLGSGGLAYWPGGHESDWGSSYAAHFLIEAREKGFNIPYGLLDKLLAYQSEAAKGFVFEENNNNSNKWKLRAQGYRLFTLALAGKPELGAMNRFRQKKTTSGIAKWYLAGAYFLAGQKNVGEKIARNLSTEIPEYHELSYSYGSTARDKAIILQMMSLVEDWERAGEIAQYLSDILSEKKWLSTHTTAYSLVAMSKYAGRDDLRSKAKFQYRLNQNESWTTVSMDAPVWQLHMEDVFAGELTFRNQSGGILYPRLIIDGIPLKGDQSDASNGLAMKVDYQTLNGQAINPLELEQGTDFRVKVTLTNTSNLTYREMVLNQVFPSGWEIHNTRLDGNASRGDSYDYQDIRDDRIYTFYSLEPQKSLTYYVMLNAAYLGQYWHPSVTSEAMYDQTINARVGGAWVKVLMPGQGG